MRKLRALWKRIAGFLYSGRDDHEFSDELESHIAMHVEDGVRSGLSAEEARRRALIQLGGAEQTRQAWRDRRTFASLEGLLQDARFGMRMLVRNRAFTVVAILTLAVGIGVSATAFTWIHAVLLEPLGGVAAPGRLVTLESVTPNDGLVPNSYPDYIDFRDRLKLLDGVAVTKPYAFSVGYQDHAERVWGELVSGDFFSVLGVRPARGRLFLPSEYRRYAGRAP